MKKYISSIFLALTFCLLAGCSINPVKKEVVAPPEPVVISNTQYVFVETPSNLLLACGVEQPPSVKDYVAADWPNKEAILTTYIKSLLGNLSVCNSKVSSIRKWSQEQKAIYDLKPKE